MKESDLERSCCTWAYRRGIDNRKLDSRVGDPDRIFFTPYGPPCFVEFKNPTGGGEIGKLQAYTLSRFIGMGYKAEFIDDLEQFKQFIEGWLNG